MSGRRCKKLLELALNTSLAGQRQITGDENSLTDLREVLPNITNTSIDSTLPCISSSMLNEILQEGPDPEEPRDHAVTSNIYESSSDFILPSSSITMPRNNLIVGRYPKDSIEHEVLLSVNDSGTLLDLSLPNASTSMRHKDLDKSLDSELNGKEIKDNLSTSQLVSDVTPMPSPYNDLIESETDISSPRYSHLSPSNSDLSSPSILSRDSSPQLSSGQNSSACSSNDNTPAGRKSRNRQRRRDEWKDIKRKCLKNLGKSYLSRNGVSRDEKKLRQACPATCRLKCFGKFTEQEREQIFLTFWQLGDHSRQWDYIANHTQVAETKYPSTSRAVSRRKKTVKYYLPLSRDSDVPSELLVCKTMYLNTLSIGERTVQTALSKWCLGGGSISPDRRGGTRVVVIDDEIKQGVIRHVNTFQPVDSHYVRKKSSKLYLDGDLTFTKMFSLYNEWCEAENIIKKAKTVRQYRDIINQNLNISFHVPKKDICNECHVYNTNKNTMDDDEKKKQEDHMKNKTIAREMKEKDKKDAIESDGQIITACFDFQKILNCPHGNVGLFYYKRKLSIHNFTVFDVARQEGFCYMWPETNGRHGSCEVASCLTKFIESKVKDGAKEFRFWSDNCAGQNRNRIVFSFYIYAAKKYGITIIHRFLERGHTQNEADSVHALIERSSKNKLIYTPEQWFALVRWSKINHPSYNVIEMSVTDFYNYKTLLSGNNWVKNSKNQKVLWNKVKEVEVIFSEPHILNYRYSFENEHNMSLITKKGYSSRRKNQSVLVSDIIDQCYKDHLPVTAAKYNDLLSLCHGRIIPQEYHHFYQNLSYGKIVEEPSDVDSSDD